MHTHSHMPAGCTACVPDVRRPTPRLRHYLTPLEHSLDTVRRLHIALNGTGVSSDSRSRQHLSGDSPHQQSFGRAVARMGVPYLLQPVLLSFFVCVRVVGLFYRGHFDGIGMSVSFSPFSVANSVGCGVCRS